MGRYDMEYVLDDIKTILTENLGAKLEAITTSKGDGMTLAVPGTTNGYHLQQLNAESIVSDPYIFYGLDDLESVPNGPEVSEKLIIFVTLVKADDGTDINISKRMFRYARAIKEVFQDDWQRVRGYSKHSIKSLMPAEFKGLNRADQFKAVGIQLEVSIG